MLMKVRVKNLKNVAWVHLFYLRLMGGRDSELPVFPRHSGDLQ